MKVDQVIGVVLAGGLSRRMEGGDKSFKQIAGQTLVERVLERFDPQVPEVIINANGDVNLFAHLKRKIIPDVFEGFAGPLAGILTGMTWAKVNRPTATHILTVPCDGPFLPRDYAEKMVEGLEENEIVMACSNGRTHPVVGLWPVRLCSDLADALEQGVRKVDQWTASYKVNLVEFHNVLGVDPFFNANRPGDLEEAERLLISLEERS